MQHWDDLRYLLALSEHTSLKNAAKFLKTDPTTVSRRIKRISEDTRKTLVTRQPNGEWVLTKDGRAFAAIANRCNVEIGILEGPVQKTSQNVTITTTDFLADHILAPQVSNVLSDQSDLIVDIDSHYQNVSLAYGEADLAIRLARPTSGKIVASKLADIEMDLFSKNGKMTKRWVGLPAKFDHHPEMKMCFEFFDCPPALRVSNFDNIRKIAVEQDLACMGPKFMMSEWGGLKSINHFSPPINREVWSIFHETRKHDEALMRVRRWVKDCFREL